jgi:hypothetical protein
MRRLTAGSSSVLLSMAAVGAYTATVYFSQQSGAKLALDVRYVPEDKNQSFFKFATDIEK